VSDVATLSDLADMVTRGVAELRRTRPELFAKAIAAERRQLTRLRGAVAAERLRQEARDARAELLASVASFVAGIIKEFATCHTVIELSDPARVVKDWQAPFPQ
jgi:hypothetical protein